MLLALDHALGSRCCFDSDGRLHVKDARLSRAGISVYCIDEGDDIPGAKLLRLDPRRRYRFLRHPDELREAAASFNGAPLLSEHAGLGEKHRPELVIGALGTDCKFVDPYLTCSLSIWTRSAIAGVQSGERREFSCAYEHAPPIMTAGHFRGERFDGVMRSLRGVHCALVAEGRAGSDCGLDMEDNIDERRFAA
jgi:hypothetical protein